MPEQLSQPQRGAEAEAGGPAGNGLRAGAAVSADERAGASRLPSYLVAEAGAIALGYVTTTLREGPPTTVGQRRPPGRPRPWPSRPTPGSA